MKKPWLLILAGVILITLIGIWLYLFFGGDEAKNDLYNAFGLQGDELPFGLEDIFGDSPATSAPQYLRQLSLRQVIGYVPLDNIVRFAEAGTGHIYSVRTENGEEERLSNITIPSARGANFSPDGTYAAITSEDGRALTIVTLPHGSTTLTSTRLEASPISTSFTSDNKLLYAVKEGQTVRGYAYDVTIGTTKVIFSIPFREVIVLWGENIDGPHYAYPKTAEELEGYLYKINSGTLTRLPVSGFGLSVIANEERLAFSKTNGTVKSNYILDQTTGELFESATAFIPEKCLSIVQGLVCAANVNPADVTVLERWYRGEISFNDSLWLFSRSSQDGLFLINLESVSGRKLDATSLQIEVGNLYFINKIDRGLWLYSDDINIKGN